MSQNNVNIDYTEAGSIRYLAPEVILYKAPANSAIDVWAMGIILYWLLHGNPPFDGQNRQIILEKIVKGSYSIHEEIRSTSTRAVMDLIEKILVVEP